MKMKVDVDKDSGTVSLTAIHKSDLVGEVRVSSLPVPRAELQGTALLVVDELQTAVAQKLGLERPA